MATVKSKKINLREELLREHSKRQTLFLVKYIGDNKKRFVELIKLFLSNEYPIAQRAAWVVSYSAIAHPHLVRSHLKKIISNLSKPGSHDAVKRNTVRLLKHIDIPKNLYGLAADACFKLLSKRDEPVAIRCFSMGVLSRLARQIPELKNELKLIIEEQMPVESAGFISRGRKTLKEIEPFFSKKPLK